MHEQSWFTLIVLVSCPLLLFIASVDRCQFIFYFGKFSEPYSVKTRMIHEQDAVKKTLWQSFFFCDNLAIRI